MLYSYFLGLNFCLDRPSYWHCFWIMSSVWWRYCGHSVSIWSRLQSFHNCSWYQKQEKQNQSHPITCLPLDHTGLSTLSIGSIDTTQKVSFLHRRLSNLSNSIVIRFILFWFFDNWFSTTTTLLFSGFYDIIAIVAGCVQTILYCDFFYLYITKVLKGKKLQLPA